MDHFKIRRHVIRALFADSFLLDHFVVKGGNALALVHGLIDRASLDIDVSLDHDFEDLDEARARLLAGLTAEFDAEDYVVLDYSLEAVPPSLSEDRKSWWGGYRLMFKVITHDLHRQFGSNSAELSRRAQAVDGMQGRIIRVDISRGEWCGGKVQRQLDGRTIYVYSEEMCVVEKFRAICQQRPSYVAALQSHATPRARDFFDIYTVVTQRGLELALPENLNLFRLIFDAKKVPLELLREIRSSRVHHESDWPAVEASVPGRVEPFDRYFDYTVDLAELVADRLLS